MVHIKDIYELRGKLYKIKNELYYENVSHKEKEIANKYLNKVIDLIEEISL